MSFNVFHVKYVLTMDDVRFPNTYELSISHNNLKNKVRICVSSLHTIYTISCFNNTVKL